VLLVEDEDAVRALAHRILRRQGYTVLDARHGVDALSVADAHRETIHLLLTDLVMPQMGGRELSERMRVLRPGISVLYTSGYTDDEVIRRGLLDSQQAFVEKPFTAETLARAVRSALDGERSPSSDENARNAPAA
jgi:two-component system, cell cycle sensor histidine kinase and response regulator CckA